LTVGLAQNPAEAAPTAAAGTWLDEGSATVGHSNSGAIAENMSIVAIGSVWAGLHIGTRLGLVTASDERIKNVVGVSDGGADLATLKHIAITDYLYKDTFRSGTKLQKKVIAQQVEAVYPNAVMQRGDFLPDIYSSSSTLTATAAGLTIAIAKPHGLKTGDRVQLWDARNASYELKVLDTPSENTFVVEWAQSATPDKLFVYGRYTDDFRVVDYDALAMLNISATQELARRNDALAQENADLKARLLKIEQALGL